MNHLLLSLILVVCLFGFAVSADTSDTKVGVIGLGAVIVLWVVMSHPSTIETFESSDKDAATKTRTLEVLSELMRHIENAETSISSLPKKHTRLQTKLVALKQTVAEMMKQ